MLNLNQENCLHAHYVLKQITHEMSISKSSICDIVKQTLHIKCFEKCRATELTEASKHGLNGQGSCLGLIKFYLIH